MAMLSYGYTLAAQKIRSGVISLDGSHAFYAYLVGPGYTPDQNNDEFYADLGNNVLSPGMPLENQVETTTAFADSFDYDDIGWDTLTFTARYLVVCDTTVTNSPLVFFVDFGTNKQASGGTFQVIWNADGVLQITVDQWEEAV
jgi:hypothetical protein